MSGAGFVVQNPKTISTLCTKQLKRMQFVEYDKLKNDPSGMSESNSTKHLGS